VAAPASPLSQLNSPAQPSGAKSPHPLSGDSDRPQGRYWLHVLATNVADVVTSIGGLIFDRAMAGWDVTVEVERNLGREADRPIRILGGRAATLVARPDGAGSAPRHTCLQLQPTCSSATNRSADWCGRRATAMQPTSCSGVGAARPLNCRLVPVRHRPSAAAQVFKSHALAARGAFVTEPAEEGFYSMT
jgi:hypothetical protein